MEPPTKTGRRPLSITPSIEVFASRAKSPALYKKRNHVYHTDSNLHSDRAPHRVFATLNIYHMMLDPLLLLLARLGRPDVQLFVHLHNQVSSRHTHTDEREVQYLDRIDANDFSWASSYQGGSHCTLPNRSWPWIELGTSFTTLYFLAG